MLKTLIFCHFGAFVHGALVRVPLPLVYRPKTSLIDPKPLWPTFIHMKTLKSFTDAKSRCIFYYFYLSPYLNSHFFPAKIIVCIWNIHRLKRAWTNMYDFFYLKANLVMWQRYTRRGDSDHEFERRRAVAIRAAFESCISRTADKQSNLFVLEDP